jgi:dTDP-4-amino-4,6-dideoxygalactose transaminase
MSTTPPAVPLCDLKAQFQPLQEEIEAAISRVLASGQVILGPEVAAFEKEAAAFCGVKHVVGCASGTDALLLAVHALGIGPGDEVILPPFTFFATAASICRAGATPVFADIDPLTFNIDPRCVEERLAPNTKAIMPVHLYGQCADMEPLCRLAEQYNLALIEDAAQAIGADYRGKQAGAIGTIGCFSFYPSKNLGAYGDAGMVTTDNPDLAALMASLRVHGMEPKYFHKHMGWNARLDALQAAILRVKLPHLEAWTTARQAAARRYDALIQSHGLAIDMRRPVALPNRRHVFNQYVVRVPARLRDGLVQHLKQSNIGCEIYYPVPLHLQECLTHLGYKEGDFPISEEAATSVIALPMFPEITEEQQARVIETCQHFFRQPVSRAA